MTSIRGWTTSPKAPYSSILSTTKINDNEFMVVSYSNYNETHGIYTYNINNNSWTIFNQDKDHKSERGLLAMDTTSNQIYMIQPQWNKSTRAYTIWNRARLHIIGLQSKKITKTFDTELDLGTNPACLCVNNRFHVISGSRKNCHYIWNNIECKFDNIATNKHWNNTQCIGFTYISSQNILLSFGGYYKQDTICKTLLDNNNNIISWHKLDIKLPIPMAQNGMIVTCDEKYIIFMGNGFNDTGENINENKEIYILDLNTWIFMKSWCSMPKGFNKGGSCAQLMCNLKQNELLILGYVRQMNCFVPNDIVQELVLWICFHEIHLFEYDTGRHWNINVSDILCGCITIPSDRYRVSK